ncbi:MAG: capsular biosynthesis protein [Lachnospiraceae bacterium]|nr:capsular biosynthesis protein [Lachnospiraceae bacterium]
MENEGSGIREYEGLTFIFDIDGTLCPIKGKDERYEDVVPYKSMVERIQEYKAGGAKIVLFTSRNMNSYHGNIGLINAHTAKIVLNWLEKWEIPYDEIIYGKPWPGHNGFYVDDRTVRPDEFLTKSVDELNEICRAGRCKNNN